MFHFHSLFVGAGGLSFLQFCNLNSFRTIFVLGYSIFIGLSVSQYFNEYTAINGYGPVHTKARWVWNYETMDVMYYKKTLNLLLAFVTNSLLLTILCALQFNDIINVPFQSKAFVAGCVAYFLDNTLHKKEAAIRKDRGKHWWDKYRSFKTDTRSEEFYSLPFNLNKYFPSV